MGRRKPPPNSLAALAESARAVYIVCTACNHRRVLEPYNVAMEMGWGATIEEIAARHRCKQCGKKQASLRSG